MKIKMYSSIALLFVALNVSSKEYHLEEVVVTTQLRPQNTSDVPISIHVEEGEYLDKFQKDSLAEVIAPLPNVHYLESGVSTQVRMRGIGSGNSQGFEQSVGLYIDGISYNRAQMLRMPVFDIDRAVFAYGPQNALHGKNSIAGSISLTSARPQDNLAGALNILHANSTNSTGSEGFITGPINNQLSGRLALHYEEQDGFIWNGEKRRNEPGVREYAGKVSFLWRQDHSLESLLTVTSSRLDTSGRPFEIYIDESNGLDLEALTGIELLSEIPNTFSNAMVALFNQEAQPPDIDHVRFADGPEIGENRMDTGVLQVSKNFDKFDVQAITGIVKFDYFESCDCDFSRYNLLNIAVKEEFEQFSQDIRFLSNGSNDTWLAGLFVQTYDQAFNDIVNIRQDNLVIPVVYGILSQSPTLGISPDAAFQLSNTGVARNFEQTSDLYSAYFQYSWNLGSKTDIIVAARYSVEEKQGNKAINIVSLEDGLAVDPNSYAPFLYGQFFAVENEQYTDHNLEGERRTSTLDPSITIEYRPSNNSLWFASLKQGSKAGGFDPRSNTVRRFEFAGEEVRAFEFGYKSTLLTNTEVSAIMHSSRYEDLQISQFDGFVGFNVGNAALTEVNGIDLSLRKLWTQSLSSEVDISYLDFEYIDFDNGNCYQGQTPDGADINGDGLSDLCDYSGKEGSYIPNLSANFRTMFSKKLKGFETNMAIEMSYMTEHNIHQNNDPRAMQDNYFLLGMYAGLTYRQWSMSIVGKNLTDEQVLVNAENVPLSAAVTGGANTVFGMQIPPRTVSVTLGFRF